MDFLQLITENPITSAALAAIGPGLYAIWRALVAAAVRRIDHAFDDPGVCNLSEDAQRGHVTNSVARSMPVLPRGVIEAEVRKKQSERPPTP